MPTELDEFYKEFQQEVYAFADADERFAEDAFFELFCQHLIDAGEIDVADRTHYAAPRGIRIDGYGGDPGAAGGTLSLIIADYSQEEMVTTITATDMDAIFKRAANFLVKSLDEEFRLGMEETTAAFGLADLVAARWSLIEKVRLFLITNRALSTRVDGREAGEVRGVPVTYSVWDLRRLHRFATAGKGREDIVIDLEREFGGAISVLPAHLTGADYEAYLAAIPGSQLAAIYDRWGARLLEQNVRVFLQARGNVNKGIRSTIENEPEMFFAYNNGITATADGVTTAKDGGSLLLTGLRNFQIVNGGQTTASIHAASRKKDVDLKDIFVQMKLSIIDPARSEEVVPRISEYANSQNRINAADFFSNHPFHVRIEGFSRRVFAPSPDGTFRESKWFYERARGQYQDARANLTPARTKKFDLEYPKRQVVTKTDLAKFLNAWRGFPHIVSRGAQKNFAHFAQSVGTEWQKRSDSYNELFYRHAIAKAIIFRETESLVTHLPWYEGGYRANIVAYTIAKIAKDVEMSDRVLDLERLWKEQRASTALKEALTLVATAVYPVLTEPVQGMRNVTEWAKTEACWSRVSALSLPWPQGMVEALRSSESLADMQKSGVKEQKMLNGIEAQIAVMNAGAETWKRVKEWGGSRRLLTQTEADILDVASAVPNKVPSEKQSLVVISTLRRLRGEGCPIAKNIG